MNADQIQSHPLLQGYAVGIPDRFRSDLTRHLCPRVPVGQSFKYVVYDDESKFEIPETRRAEGSEGPYVNQDAKLESSSTESRALNTVLDKRVIDAADAVAIPIVQRNLNRIVNLRERETHKRVVETIEANATAGGSIAASGADDPVEKLDDIIAAFMLENKIEDPMDVRLTVGVKAFTKIRNSEKVLARRSGGGVKSALTMEEFQNMLAFGSTAMLSTIINQTSKLGKTRTFARYWDNTILLTIGRDGMVEDDNSFMKQFYNEENWMNLRSWESGSGRILSAGLDYEDRLLVTNPTGAKKITIT